MKKIITVFLCFAFSLMLFIPVNAETDDGLPRVVDNAGLFTEEQLEDLTARVDKVADKYDIEYLLVTCDDLEGMSAQTYAAEFPYNNGYCEYGEFEGIILFLSVDPYDKGYYTQSFNSYQDVFTTKVREKINDIIYDDMKAGNYYDGFKEHIKIVG
ncbi:MAG: TPM domain-containing protein, partial [Clostridia bacterium]|nr:TPM domain-containing protein [Clostridia bacterium]